VQPSISLQTALPIRDKPLSLRVTQVFLLPESSVIESHSSHYAPQYPWSPRWTPEELAKRLKLHFQELKTEFARMVEEAEAEAY
jgi:hypothetical protein